MIALCWKLSSVSSCPWSEWWLVHVLDDCLMALETLFSVLLSMVRMMVSTCIRWLPHWKLSSVSYCPWSEWWLVHVLDDCLMALETLFSVLLSMVRMMVSTCIQMIALWRWKHSSVSYCPWSEWWLVHVLDDCLYGVGNSLQCPTVHGQNDG